MEATTKTETFEVPGAGMSIERGEGGLLIDQVTLTYAERTLVAKREWLEPYESPHFYQTSSSDQEPTSRFVQVIGKEDLGDGAWGPWERISLRLTPNVAILLEREVTGEHPGALGIGAGVLPLKPVTEPFTGPYTKTAAIEVLADVEHERWGDWQGYQHGLCEEGSDARGLAGALIIPEGLKLHWERLIDTKYADLPEHSKQADRDQVMRYWPFLVQFVAGWMQEHIPDGFFTTEQVDQWLEDMA